MKKNKAGVQSVEIVVVVAIIAILSAIFIPNLHRLINQASAKEIFSKTHPNLKWREMINLDILSADTSSVKILDYFSKLPESPAAGCLSIKRGMF